jgi:hypothetical protein
LTNWTQKPGQNSSDDPETQRGMVLLAHALRWWCVFSSCTLPPPLIHKKEMI